MFHYYYMINHFHKTIQNLSNNRGAIFIDLDNELDFNLANDFYDSVHHTPSGAKKIGEALYENLKSLF